MGIIGTIVIGFIVGVLAKFLHPGKEDMGIVVTTVLGIAGSFVASYVGQALNLYPAGNVGQFIAAVIGAVVLLVVYGMVKSRTG